MLKVFQSFTGIENYNGVFQEFPSKPGTTYHAGGWSKISTDDTLKGQNSVWIELTFRDSANNILALYKSDVVTKDNYNIIGNWTYLDINDQYDPQTYTYLKTVYQITAPPLTSSVRYQIVFQGDALWSSGAITFDDLNLDQITDIKNTNTWKLVWNDEFQQPNGSKPDPTKWSYALGNNNGWGNNEIENYTSSTINAHIENKNLVISAQKQIKNGVPNYTSARLFTKANNTWTTGRFEARIKVPNAQGIWPAFWTLGKNFNTVGWPTCGEIDIMETIGKEPNVLFGTIHSDNYTIGQAIKLPYNTPYANDYHIYAVELDTDKISWYIDDQLYQTVNKADVQNWPFNQPQILLLNLAIGGNWPGYPDQTTIFPQQMYVDYVRIYQKATPSKNCK